MSCVLYLAGSSCVVDSLTVLGQQSAPLLAGKVLAVCSPVSYDFRAFVMFNPVEPV